MAKKLFLAILLLLLLLPVLYFASPPAESGEMARGRAETISRENFKTELDANLETNLPFFPIKYAVGKAVSAGIPAATIVLLLLLPAVSLIIAASRHIVGIRGFGIFLPAALSVVFSATGPLWGIGLFLLIVSVATVLRFFLRRLKVRLAYLPRMSLILWFVAISVFAVIFATAFFPGVDISSISIFAILILALLVEDFIRVQLGKSIRVALDLTAETLILALVSYFFLSAGPVREFAIANPEILLGGVFVGNLALGRYTGLRIMEIVRFRRLITS